MMGISLWGLFSLIVVVGAALAIAVAIIGFAVAFVRHMQPVKQNVNLKELADIIDKIGEIQ